MDSTERRIFFGEDYTADFGIENGPANDEQNEEELDSGVSEDKEEEEEEQLSESPKERHPSKPRNKTNNRPQSALEEPTAATKNINLDANISDQERSDDSIIEEEEEEQDSFLYTYTLSKMESHSTYLPAPIAEYIIEKVSLEWIFGFKN